MNSDNLPIIGRRGALRFGDLEVWAERGLINVQNTVDGEHHRYSVRDFAWHVLAINDMAGNTLLAGKLRGETKKLAKRVSQAISRNVEFAEKAYELMRVAKEQAGNIESKIQVNRDDLRAKMRTRSTTLTLSKNFELDW